MLCIFVLLPSNSEILIIVQMEGYVAVDALLMLCQLKNTTRAMLLNQVLPLVNPFKNFHPIRGKEEAIYSLVVHYVFV